MIPQLASVDIEIHEPTRTLLSPLNLSFLQLNNTKIKREEIISDLILQSEKLKQQYLRSFLALQLSSSVFYLLNIFVLLRDSLLLFQFLQKLM